MKKILVVAAVEMMVMALAGGVFAAPPLDVQVGVNAAVTNKCAVTSPGALNITIDPELTVDQPFTPLEPVAHCTKTKGGMDASITAESTNAGTTSNTGTLVGSLDSGAGNPIPYTFTFNPTVVGNGFGAGAPVAFGIGGSVASGDAQVAEYGSYTDTVTLTLAY